MTASGDSSGATTVATAAKLCDEALAAARLLEEEAASLRSTNAERGQQLLDDAELLKSAAAAQDRVRAAPTRSKKNARRPSSSSSGPRPTALRRRPRDHGPRDDDSQAEDDDSSLVSDAAAIARLHSQAAAVQNIRNLIPVVLDLQASNFSKWRGHVLLILGRFALQDHVLSDVPPPHDSAWTRMDCVVGSWLINTISPDLLDIIHDRDGVSARVAWLGLEEQFLNNRESRAMLLDAEFRVFSQGALSIDDYCRKMKGMADALADLGEPIQDRTLVLNIPRGLNERFQVVSQLIPHQRPFPSFADVRADLRLAELNMAPSSTPPPSALVATSTTKTPPPPAPVGPGSPVLHQHMGVPLAEGATGAVVAAAVTAVPLVAPTEARNGLPSTTRGQGPSTCGLVALGANLLAPDQRRRRRTR
jgi:hypothetical protein